MNKEIIMKDENNHDIKISCLGIFNIEDLEKKYIIYSIINELKEDACAMIGEYVTYEDGSAQVLGVKKEEKDVVLAYYNEIINQLGE